MKLFCFLALFTLTVSTVSVEKAYKHGENGWYIPQVNDSDVWMDLNEIESEVTKWKNMTEQCEQQVDFYLYTDSNPTEGQKIDTTYESIKTSNFNPNNPTRFIIHGHLQRYTSSLNEEIRKAWLSRADYNIISVDWKSARSIYIVSLLSVPDVGRKVAQMVDFLVNNYEMSLDTLHVIGHSLGAHVAGHTGKNVKTGEIHCIVGLDPARPFIEYMPEGHLNSTDAWYVQSIHTCGKMYGFREPLGKGAFYPNGGESQPGCKLNVLYICSHNLAPTYYAESVEKQNFLTQKCKNLEELRNKTCENSASSVRMGAVTEDDMVAGIYYVPVNSESPYGTGK